MSTLDPKSASMRLWNALLAHGVTAEEATVLMNGYAHELAERQRAWLHAYADEPGEMPKDQEDITEMIGLIDPAKSKGATCSQA
ncbi:hypothetical protein [Streptomyces caniscabiei]|uniref:Uncharacterized protein n=1 Tax=Streptomyces caniscabiei TaxID=2746961 RepID=A0ABU4MPV2_9ACTN|nr:hypothetical protein [Streptomyces caniscabiei]MBE4788409.1 hypothetical protein [Streptomyces caniscabiei]MDX2954608.1 hypothetical protein [Streptomyces caniscabiei]MDX2986579.1 hypothetical protein [Streptomyces caniscabiei]MDX3039458.1 hypothetical protein [Streptomyces caniscabiei]